MSTPFNFDFLHSTQCVSQSGLLRFEENKEFWTINQIKVTESKRWNEPSIR